MPTLKLEPVVAARLIDRLSNDDAYRVLFTESPAAALHEVGHIADVAALDAFLTDCFAGVKLADKDTIGSAREAIHSMLTKGASQAVPMLDANAGAQRSLLAAPANAQAA